MSTITALILAGGKSSRMGRDKAFIKWKDKTFIQHLFEAVTPLTKSIVLSGTKEKLALWSYPVIEDKIKDQGPVIALASCFEMIESYLTLVLSCDVPQITTFQLSNLLKAHRAEYDVTMFSYKGKDMPLVAVYSVKAFPAFAHAMESGDRKLFNVINQLHVQKIEYTGPSGLANINKPEHLKELE